MTIAEHLSNQPPDRQPLLKTLHAMITQLDPLVTPEVGTMMRAEMILYNQGTFKYGLAGGGKEHISLHLLPMYVVPAIHEKYSKLLPKAKFQKGCINFKNADELPLDIAAQLIEDCAPVDLAAIRRQQLDAKKKK